MAGNPGSWNDRCLRVQQPDGTWRTGGLADWKEYARGLAEQMENWREIAKTSLRPLKQRFGE